MSRRPARPSTSRRTGAAPRAARSGTPVDCRTEGVRRTAASPSPFFTEPLTTRTRSMTTTDGTIKRITDKGFGFIATAEGTEYFFHQSACAGTRFDDLREGQAVSFTVGQGPKGPRAENVNLR